MSIALSNYPKGVKARHQGVRMHGHPPNEEDLQVISRILKEYSRRQDDWLSRHSTLRVSCHKGCNGCCDMSVNISLLSGFLIRSAANSDDWSSSGQAGARHLDFARKWQAGESSYFYHFRKQLATCPYLHRTGECGIYKTRPLMCRAVISTFEPDYCRRDFGEGPEDPKMDCTRNSAYHQGTPYVVPLVRMTGDPQRRIREYMWYRWGFWMEGEMNFLIHLIQHAFPVSRFWEKTGEEKERWLKEQQYPKELVASSFSIPGEEII